MTSTLLVLPLASHGEMPGNLRAGALRARCTGLLLALTLLTSGCATMIAPELALHTLHEAAPVGSAEGLSVEPPRTIASERMLTRNEILSLVAKAMKQYNLPMNLTPWRGR
ncbi:hypothetical protein [Cystobacter fuscus]|uniref:hypothetical protein n=1 Tax=Cystobacter fuscus TaxID=43 RepID=UPI0037C0785F